MPQQKLPQPARGPGDEGRTNLAGAHHSKVSGAIDQVEEISPHAGEPADARTFEVARRGLQVMLIAAIILALTNSFALQRKLNDLPPNDVTDKIVNFGEQWHGLMERSGMSVLGEKLRAGFKAMRQIGWPGAGEDDAVGGEDGAAGGGAS